MNLDEYNERSTRSGKKGTLAGQKVTCGMKVDRKLLNVEGDRRKREMGEKGGREKQAKQNFVWKMPKLNTILYKLRNNYE